MGRVKYIVGILGKYNLIRFFLVFGLYFSADIGLLVLPVLYGQILNITEQTKTFPAHKFLLYLILTVLLFSVRALARFLNNLLKIDFFKEISISALKNLLFVRFDNIARKGREYYSDIVLNKSLDVSSLFDIDSMSGFINLLRLVVITTVIFFMDKVVWLSSLMLIFVSTYIYRYGTEYFMKGYSEVVEKNKTYLSNVDDVIKNREEIIAFDSIKTEIRRNNLLTEMLRQMRSVLLSRDFVHFFIELDFTRVFYELFVFAWSLHSVYIGRYPIGTGLVLIGYGSMMAEPIAYLNSILSGIKKDMNSLEILESLGENKPNSSEESIDTGEKIKRISFENVGFSVGKRKIFDNLSFDIIKGETVSLVGPSGCGKSIVVSLILKDKEKSNGHILINDKPIEDVPKKWILDNISVLSQNSTLFPGTVKENITLGNDSLNDIDLKKILKSARVLLPLDYLININADNVSQGEKARILLARVIATNKDFVILDEPLEGVDEKTKNEILIFLKKYLKNKTCLLITHKQEIAEFLSDKTVRL